MKLLKHGSGCVTVISINHFLTLGIASASVVFAAVAFGQSAVIPSQPSSSDTTSVAQGKPAQMAQRDILSDDPRLDSKVTFLRRAVTVDITLAELAKQAKVRMTVGNSETALSPIAIAVKDAPLRDVMRALASLNNLHWTVKKTPDQQPLLILQEKDDLRRLDYLRPTSQADADTHREVHTFLNQVAQLPPALQEELGDTHQGVPLGSLPQQMQQTVSEALKARLVKVSDISSRLHIPVGTQTSPDNLGDTRVTLAATPTESGMNYTLRIVSDNSEVGMGTTIPSDPALSDIADTVVSPTLFPFQYQEDQREALMSSYDDSRVKAIKDDSRLNQLVSIKTEDASAGYPLAALADAAHVNIIAQVMPETHTVSLGPVPLKDALDQVAAKYHAAWGVTTGGAILFHYRANKLVLDEQAATK